MHERLPLTMKFFRTRSIFSSGRLTWSIAEEDIYNMDNKIS